MIYRPACVLASIISLAGASNDTEIAHALHAQAHEPTAEAARLENRMAQQSLDVKLPLFSELDKAGSGKITMDDFGGWWRQQGRTVFSSVNKDNDDVLSEAEYSKLGHILQDVSLSGSSTWGSRFWNAFFNSVAMILATEVGDKTFFIAAVLAMRHAHGVVFAGAIGALIVMTILSVVIGFSLPSLLPREYTHWCATGLFFYFGLKLLFDARQLMVKGEGLGPSDELDEVEHELATQGLVDSKDDGEDIELANVHGEESREMLTRDSKIEKGQVVLVDPGTLQIVSQVFMLTFLAEWGDRSQIATIAMAADKEPIGVTVGGIVGHSMCTGVACVGGRYLAARISERSVILVGGILFMIFGFHSLLVGADS
eukprot:GEMP01020288.1.p1 GENE.GEMP01020288.1~~GEMP01020288.1.p1  ORF type:complete len:370 (+),score=76.80 GEMP01020288.1:104-1213(+)